jgi:serine/threonine protein kinase
MGVSAGQLIDKRYSLANKIGEGGMGVIYSAHDLEADRDIAVKFMK